MAGQSVELIPQLLGEGDRAVALEQAQRLLEHIRRTREDGVSAEDLAVAASRARQLLEHIEHTPVR
jgi:ribosomal protein S15P/S13E